MIHQRQRLALGLEPGDDLLGVHAQLDDLQRHAPTHRLGLLRHVHHATATFTDFLQQLVAADGLAHGFVGSIGEVELEDGPNGFGLGGQQRLRLLVRGQQGVEPLAQGRGAVAGAVQKGRTPGRVFDRQGLVEERRFQVRCPRVIHARSGWEFSE